MRRPSRAGRLSRTGRVALAPAVLAAVLIGCASAAPSSATPTATATGPSPAPSAVASAPVGASPALSRDDGWRADIDLLLEAREQIHPDPWHGMTRADWVAAANAVKAAIPTLTDEQALVELVRLAAMPGWAGRDGHTGIFPFIPDSGTHEYPIKLWQFNDGMVITDAQAPYEDLVGTRLLAISGRPIAEVLALVEPLAPRDNPSNLLAYAPLYLRTSEVLAGLGVLERAGSATFTVADPSGVERDVVVEPIEPADDIAWHGGEPLTLPVGEPLWLQDRDAALWWEFLPESGTLYVQYSSVEAGIDRVADEILERARQDDVERVVVDLRKNGGGDNGRYRTFLHDLEDDAIDRPGRLVLLIGRLTFSAAANFATELDQTTGAWFAGEDMGGSPNLYGDARRTDLPTSHQTVYIASRYWQKSTADDERITIEPDLPVNYTFEDWLAGRDPVLDAVIAETPPGG